MTADAVADPASTKAAAWDRVASLFWTLGRKTARPSPAELELLAAGIEPATPCTVVGASTIELVSVLLERGCEVTVLDFSSRMCDDLRDALDHETCRILPLDITRPLPAELLGTQHHVLSDRLLNRFDTDELGAALAAMASLLGPGGEVRASVKLGLYPMDVAMIELGTERGTLADFYDEQTKTIDFAAAGDVLEDALLPHGDIDRATLLAWYVGRGRERRLEHEDVVVALGDAALELVATTPMPDAPGSAYYVARLRGQPVAPCAGS